MTHVYERLKNDNDRKLVDKYTFYLKEVLKEYKTEIIKWFKYYEVKECSTMYSFEVVSSDEIWKLSIKTEIVDNKYVIDLYAKNKMFSDRPPIVLLTIKTPYKSGFNLWYIFDIIVSNFFRDIYFSYKNREGFNRSS